MTRHDIWYFLNRWKLRIVLITSILTALGFGISKSEAVLQSMDNLAQRYINARVDKKINERIGSLEARQEKTEMQLQELITVNNQNAHYMKIIIDALIKKGVKNG